MSGEEAGLLGEWYEGVRHSQALGGMVPTREQFEPDQNVVGKADQRLEVRVDLIVGDRHPDGGLLDQTQAQLRVHAGFEVAV